MTRARHNLRGFTLLEILVTLVILAFGILGLASLQAKVHVVEMESYQRAQAVILLQDMVSRINANRDNAADYRTDRNNDGDITDANEWLGTGITAAIEDCSAPATRAAIDRCEWQTRLLGAAETRGGANIGAMAGARGCIERLQAPVGSPTCTPGSFRVTVVWQGFNQTAAPSLLCAQSANAYGGDSFRRAIAAIVTIGQPGCV